VWLVTDRYTHIQNRRAIGWLLLLSVALILRFGLQPSYVRVLGSSSAEKAALYLTEHFRPDTHVGAWGPATIWAAKMTFVRMAGVLRYMESASDLWEWMARERVEAIYVDEDLRMFEPAVWDTLQRQIGSGLTVTFDGGDGSVQILVRR
jgi:hypothetical protein